MKQNTKVTIFLSMKKNTLLLTPITRNLKRALWPAVLCPLPPPTLWTMAYVPHFKLRKEEITVYV